MPFKKNSFFDTSRVTVITVSLAILVALVALVGWIFNLESLRTFNPNWPSIKMNTIIGMIFSGVSLLFFIKKKKETALFLALIVFLLGIVSLSEYIFHWNAHIDELFFLDRKNPVDKYPGRMALLTCSAFIITGICLLTYSIKKKWAQRVSECSAILVFIMSFAGFIGALYDAGQAFRAANIASFSIPTSLSGLFMALGLLFSKPDTGVIAAFHKQTAAARTGLKGIVIIIFILVVIGLLSLKGNKAGLFGSEMSLVVMIITFTISFLFVAWSGIRRLNITEDRLIASEKNLRYVLSSIADIFYVIDKNYRITLINEAAEEKLTKAWGKTVRLGANILDLIPKETNEPIKNSFEKVFRGERIEYELSHPGGDLSDWVLVNYMPVSDDDGTIIGAYIVTKDITERKKAEEELQKSQERYRSLIEQASDYIMITDEKGNFTDVNSSLCNMFGYTREDLLQMNINDIIDKEQLENDPVRFDLLLSGQAILRERRMMNKDGSVIEVEANVKMLPDGRILAIARDIRERKKIEQELKEAEIKFRNLVEQSLVGVYIIQDGKFAYVNPRFAEIFGYNQQELINSYPVEIVVYPDDRQIVTENIRTRLQGEKDSVHYEVNGQKKNGEIIRIEIFGSRTQYVGKPGIIGTLLDVSHRKKAEEELKASESKYKLLFEKNPLPMWMVSMPERDFIDVNEAAIVEYGYSKEEFLIMNARDIRPAEELERYNKQATQTANAATNILGVWRHKKKNGAIIYVDIVTHDIIYQGRLVRLVLANNVTEKYMAEEQLKHSYEQIRRLSEHLQNIREEERTHIAREIHDELGQQLTVLKMDASWLNKKLSSSDNDVKEKLRSLLELLDATVKSVRRISSELRPSLLDDMGLAAAMEWHLKEFEKRSAVKIHFTMPEKEIILPDTIKTGLFRIFQESLTNVARHAGAQEVKIDLRQKNGQIELRIQDDGKGFDKEKAANKKTLGILGMKERSFMMGGNYHISSTLNEGTIVLVSVPY